MNSLAVTLELIRFDQRLPLVMALGTAARGAQTKNNGARSGQAVSAEDL